MPTLMRFDPEPSPPPVCPRCGKRHPVKWQHRGDCRCGRPLSRQPHAVMCDVCAANARPSDPPGVSGVDVFEMIRRNLRP